MTKPNLKRRLSGIDAAFIYLERKEIPLHIATVCTFESSIDYEEFVADLESKLDLLPRYRQVLQIPQFNLGYPVWEDAEHFNIRDHIHQVHLESPGGQAELEALAGRIVTVLLDRGKPLWDIHLVDGLADGRGAIIARIHHALADGISGASLLQVMLDATPNPPRRPKVKPSNGRGRSAPRPSVADSIASGIHSSLEGMIAAEAILLDMAQGLFTDRMQSALQQMMDILPEFATSSDRMPFNKPCIGQRGFCWSECSLERAKEIRDAAGGTINDVILTAVTRGVADYVKLHGEPVAGRFLRMVCPVSVRQSDSGQSLGNQISFLPVALPLGAKPVKHMLREVARRTDAMKSAKAAHLVGLAASWLASAPPPLQAFFWRTIPLVPLPSPLLHMICTNVPGPQHPLYLVGRRMLAVYPHVPTGYELGVNCAVDSYDGRLFFGYTTDTVVVPDATALRDFVAEAFDRLYRETVPRQRRRAPAQTGEASRARKRAKPMAAAAGA